MRANIIANRSHVVFASVLFFGAAIGAGRIILPKDSYAHDPHEPDPFVLVT